MGESLPPQDLDAERALLGAVLFGGSEPLDDARATGLRGGMFYSPLNGAIWNVVCQLTDQGKPVDPTAVLTTCPPSKKQHVGPALAEISSASGMPAAAAFYARVIRDTATLRGTIAAADGIRQRAFSAPHDRARETLEAAQAALDGVLTGLEREPLVRLQDLLPDAVERMDAGEVVGMPTPWTDLNELIGAMRPGQLFVIGARPSVGKTMLAINLLAHAAGRLHSNVLLSSLEMTRHEIADRFLSHVAQVDLTAIIQGDLSDDDWKRLSAGVERLNGWPLEIDDASHMTTSDIRGRMRQIRRQQHLGLVVVDYLQLVSPRDRRLPREQQIAEITADLKGLGKDFQVPMVALAQLSRQADNRRGKRPTLSDLRESGAIENTADIVGLLHRENDREAELNIAKNRQGRTGKVDLVWQPYVMRALSRA